MGKRLKLSQIDIEKYERRKKARRRSGRIMQKLWRKHGPHCVWCGRFTYAALEERDGFTELRSDSATIEHLIPLSRGGTWEMSNLRIACHRCNSARGSRPEIAPGDTYFIADQGA